MDAPQGPQPLCVQGLDPDGEAVDPGGAVGGEVGGIRRAGVGLQGDLGIGGQVGQAPYPVQQPGDGRPGEEARGPAADEDRDQGAPGAPSDPVPVQVLAKSANKAET